MRLTLGHARQATAEEAYGYCRGKVFKAGYENSQQIADIICADLVDSSEFGLSWNCFRHLRKESFSTGLCASACSVAGGGV